MPSPADASKPVTIAVVDDRDVIHDGIAAWCAQADPPIRIGSSHRTAESFLTVYPKAGPELTAVVIDLESRVRPTDFDAVAAIVGAGHAVIVYPGLESAEIIQRCLDIGVSAYLTRSDSPHRAVEAIRAAGAGAPRVGPSMTAAPPGDAHTGRPHITDRELQVLKAWSQPESNDVVARRLQMAPSTVRTHLERVRAKYAEVGRPAATKAELVARAVQDGILDIDNL